MTIHLGFAFAFVIAFFVISCGQNVVIASSLSNDNNNIRSIRIKRRTVARILASGGGSASSFSVDTTAVSGPFYVIRQDVEGNLYAQISETYDMNKYETVSCTEVGHHPVIISCPYGGSSLDIEATMEPAKHQISYHDAHGKFKQVLHDEAEVKPNFLRSNSLPNEELNKQTKQVETVYGNQEDSKKDTSSSTDASSSTEESHSTDTALNPPAIAAISVVSVFFMLFFAYCTCCCLVDDDDDDDSDADEEEDEFDLDDNQSMGKFRDDDHTSVTRGLGGSVASLYDVDLSTNESENGDQIDDLDIDNDDHIHEENNAKSSPPKKLMDS